MTCDRLHEEDSESVEKECGGVYDEDRGEEKICGALDSECCCFDDGMVCSIILLCLPEYCTGVGVYEDTITRMSMRLLSTAKGRRMYIRW